MYNIKVPNSIQLSGDMLIRGSSLLVPPLDVTCTAAVIISDLPALLDEDNSAAARR